MKLAALIVVATWCASPAAADALILQVYPEDAAARSIVCSAVLADGKLEVKRAWGINTMFDTLTRDATAQDSAAFAALAAAFADGTIPATAGPLAVNPPRPSVSLSFRPNPGPDDGIVNVVLPGTDVPAEVVPVFADVFDGDCLDAGLN